MTEAKGEAAYAVCRQSSLQEQSPTYSLQTAALGPL